jgi:hypothetical protein
VEYPNKKPSVAEVLPVVKAWYAKPGNRCGGMFHVILDDGNHEQHWATSALAEARASGNGEAIHLVELLVAMSPTQRRKLSHLDKS